MHLFGLHIVDAALIVIYFLALFWISIRISRRIRGTEEYFLAGRRIGKFYQFFLNFGASTDASQAAAVTREIYRQGIAGMWIQYIVLFLTPFYWFTAMLFRRARLTTIGDFFEERFESRGLGVSFAAFTIFLAMLSGAMGYLVSAKTFMALTPKPESAYSQEERLSVAQYREYQSLRQAYQSGLATPEQRQRLRTLEALNSQGRLNAFISYTRPVVFYVIYATCVCVYVLLGGFEAAAVTDAFQGILMVLFSALLIPFGLAAVGGFSGLHAVVPEHMFWLFGTGALGEYAWYTIAAMALANLVSIVALAQNMQTGGSAKNEATARFGMIGGLMLKRVMMIFWALAGLIALGLYAGQLSDPDLAWGHLTRNLLSPGFIGIMMVGVLAASMSTLDATAVAASALVVNQLYRPWFPHQSEAHYIRVGRAATVAVIYGSVLMALAISNLLELFKYAITAPGIFGAAIWLGFLWRRLSRAAVIAQIILSVLLVAVIPNLFQSLPAARAYPPFLEMTRVRHVTLHVRALRADVEAGRANTIGERIIRERVVAPVAIFYDSIARQDPENPNSRLLGYGRFNAELWLLHCLGVKLQGMRKAQLVALRFLVDALFPFAVLLIVSYFTRGNSPRVLDYFYAKIHTPVQPTPEMDTALIAVHAADPASLAAHKLFPGSAWEIHRPSRMDYAGFFGTWVLVGAIILMLWGVMKLGT